MGVTLGQEVRALDSRRVLVGTPQLKNTSRIQMLRHFALQCVIDAPWVLVRVVEQRR